MLTSTVCPGELLDPLIGQYSTCRLTAIRGYFLLSLPAHPQAGFASFASISMGLSFVSGEETESPVWLAGSWSSPSETQGLLSS